MGLLTNRINNKLEKSNLVNGHAPNREPVALKLKTRINSYNPPPPPPTLVTPTYIPSFAGESRLTTGAPND